MREIKFRAWNGYRKEINRVLNMGWFDGIYMNISLDIEKRKIDYWDSPDNMMCDDIKIMQYTGVKDKNGKEIYEGDIVKANCDKAIVEYSDDYSGYILKPIGEYYFDSPMLAHNMSLELEVLGNIYENPELLKGE